MPLACLGSGRLVAGLLILADVITLVMGEVLVDREGPEKKETAEPATAENSSSTMVNSFIEPVFR